MKLPGNSDSLENENGGEASFSPRALKWPGMVLFFLFLLILLFLSSRYVELPRWNVDRVLTPIREMGPVPFFAAAAVLPLAAFPMTPFYLVAGATFGAGLSMAAMAIAQAVQLTLSYWMAVYFFRASLERLVRRTSYSIPVVPPRNHWKFALLVKMTPGPPGFLKNYIIALAHVPFRIYFLVTWPVAMAYAVAVILLGDSIMDGNVKQALGAVALVVFCFAVIWFLRRRAEAGRRSE